MAPEKTSALVGPGAAGMIAEKSSAPAGQKGAVNLGDPSLNVKARVMQPHGSYVRVKPKDGAKLVQSQSALIAIAREGGVKSPPYAEGGLEDGVEKQGRDDVLRPSDCKNLRSRPGP